MLRNSCGNTLKCFAGLFLSKQQATSHQIDAIVDGLPAMQMLENLNILLFSFRKWINAPIRIKNNWIFTDIFNYLSRRQVEALTKALLEEDDPQMLPKVIFCNVAWVMPHKAHPIPNPIAMDHDANCPSNSVKDHKWAIIKHSADRFQVVQGYVPHISLPANCKAHDHKGYCLSSWQRLASNSAHIPQVQAPTEIGSVSVSAAVAVAAAAVAADASTIGGAAITSNNKCGSSDFVPAMAMEVEESVAAPYIAPTFSSRHGFSGAEMQRFLNLLGDFAANRNFDAAAYCEMFGVYHDESDGRTYWPSFSSRELSDDSIIGCGDRFMAESMNHYINDSAAASKAVQ